MTERKRTRRGNREADLSTRTGTERRDAERQTLELDALSGGAYFMKRADRLHRLASVLVALAEDFYDQADDLRWDLKMIQPLVEQSRRSRRRRDADVVS